MPDLKISQLPLLSTSALTDVFAVVPTGSPDTYKVTLEDIKDFITPYVVNDIGIPSQIGQNGKYLYTDGTNIFWQSISSLSVNLQQVLLAGNTSDQEIILNGGSNGDLLLSGNDTFLGSQPTVLIRDLIANKNHRLIIDRTIYNNSTYQLELICPTLNNTYVLYYPLSSGTLATSVNGTFADASGNITIATGGISSLNSLTSSTQTFAVNTSGGDFNIFSSGSQHTFNLPTASGTVRGALSSADWITFNSKLSATLTADYLPIATGSNSVGDSALRQVVAGTQTILKSTFSGIDSGIFIQYNSSPGFTRQYIFGDYGNIWNGTYLRINDQNREIYTNSGNLYPAFGWYVNFNSQRTEIGDFLGLVNGNKIVVDDSSETNQYVSVVHEIYTKQADGRITIWDGDINNRQSTIMNPYSNAIFTSNVYYNVTDFRYHTLGYGAMMLLESVNGTINFYTSPLNSAGNDVIHTPLNRMQVLNNGNVNINKITSSNYRLDIGASTNGLRVTGSGTTSATITFRAESSAAITNLVVLDNGNVGIREANPSARLHLVHSGATTASIGLKVRNSGDTFDILKTYGNGQVQVSSSASALDPSAQLQIDSTIRGLLIPRMTNAEVLAIVTPANGLLVYNTTINHLVCYQGGVWVKFSHSPM